jgi:hypothetical protein
LAPGLAHESKWPGWHRTSLDRDWALQAEDHLLHAKHEEEGD